MRKANIIAIVLCTAGVAASAQQTGDFAQPTWRGQALTTYGQWDFLTVSAPVGQQRPEVFTSVGGSMGEMLHPQMPVGAVFDLNNLQPNPTGPGWVAGPQTGFMDFNLPNWIDMEPRKDIRIQMSFSGPMDAGAPSVSLIEAFDRKVFPGTSYQGVFESRTLVGPGQVYEDWSLMPNPDWEIIKVAVPAGVTLTQVTIDTISWVPSPSSAALLCFAGLVAAQRRR
jgi:hypothetical protein